MHKRKEVYNMICTTPKELLAEIKKYMDLHDIQTKDLAVNMKKSQQSVSQIFQNGNPKCSTIFEICEALNIYINVDFKNKSDTE